MSSVPESLLQRLRSEIQGVAALTNRIIQVGTWQYPPKGIVYFATHRNLWKPLAQYVIPLFALSFAVITTMFTFTYIPQSIILTFFSGPWAWISTIGLVLGESSAIIGIIARHWFLEEGVVEVYDMVLKENGAQHLLQRETDKERERERTGNKIAEVARKKFHPTSILQEIKQSLFYAPLNFLPLIGPLLFLIIQARVQAPGYHDRYFFLKGFTEQEKREFIKRNKEGYLGFGIVALLLGMVPVVNVIVTFTNIVGAALWAADIEKGVYVSGVGLRKDEKKIDKKEGWKNENGFGSSTATSASHLGEKSYADVARGAAEKKEL